MVVGLTLLTIGALAVVVVLAVSARRPAAPPPDLAGYLLGWSRLHDGITASGLVRRWLGLVFRLARPAAALGLSPDALTLLGIWISAAAVPAAAAHGRWPLLGVAALVASGLTDNVDGAVAVLAGRATALGHVLDSLADRVCDGLGLLALWLLGAPGWAVLAGGGAVLALEYTRARAATAGRGPVTVVTPGERPTRIILTLLGLLAAAVFPGHRVDAATVAAVALLGICALSWLLLMRAVVRHLR